MAGRTPWTARLAGLAACCLLAACASAQTTAAPAPPCTDDSAACLRSVASLYLEALTTHDGSRLPLAPTVRRTENALTNASGEHEVRESFERTRMVKAVRDPRFIVDAASGNVVVYFMIDVDLQEADAKDTTTKAGDSEYKVAVTVPAGTYTVHEAERFRVVKGYITEIDIIAHVEPGKGAGNGWSAPRSK